MQNLYSFLCSSKRRIKSAALSCLFNFRKYMGIEIILYPFWAYAAYLFAVDSCANCTFALTHAEHCFKFYLIFKILLFDNVLQTGYNVVGAAEMTGTAYTNLNRYQNMHPLSVFIMPLSSKIKNTYCALHSLFKSKLSVIIYL